MDRTTFAQDHDDLFLDAIFCSQVVVRTRRTTELLHHHRDLVELVHANPFTIGAIYVAAHMHLTALRQPARRWLGFRPVLDPAQCAWMLCRLDPFEACLLGMPESTPTHGVTAMQPERVDVRHVRRLALAIRDAHHRGDGTGPVFAEES